MKRRIALITLLFTLLLISGSIEAVEFDLSLDAVEVHYTKTNPLEIQVEKGEAGSINTKFFTKYFTLSNNLLSTGEFESSIFALPDAFYQSSRGNAGDSNPDGKSTTLVKEADSHGELVNLTLNGTYSAIKAYYDPSRGEGKDTAVKYHSSWGKNKKNSEVETTTMIKLDDKEDLSEGKIQVDLKTTKAEKGVLRVDINPDLQVSDSEKVSQRLGISRGGARDLLDKYGTLNVHNVIDALDNLKTSNNRNNPTTAGGAGAVAGPEGVVSIKNIATKDLFNLYIRGIKYQGHVRYNSVFLNLYNPSSGEKLSQMSAKVTLEGPVKKNLNNNERSNIVLLGSLNYKKGTGYHYSFSGGDWLMPPKNLTSGPYRLHLDIGKIKHLTLPVKLTESNTVVPR